MIHLISVQGKYAAPYRFKNETGENFAILISNLVSGPSALISSKFRTDLLYDSDADQNAELTRVWGFTLGLNHAMFEKKWTVMLSGRQAMMEHYFTSLAMLNNMSTWYHEYIQEFRKTFILDRLNPILRQLISCDYYLHEAVPTCHREPLMTDTAKEDFPLPCDFSQIALRAICDTSSN